MSQKASKEDTKVVKIEESELMELHIVYSSPDERKLGNSLGYSTGCKEDGGEYQAVFLKQKQLSPAALKKITAILEKEIS